MILRAESVYHSFGAHSVLSGAYIECETGKTVGLLGRNGSGKSTLFRIIAGLLDPDNASVTLDNVHLKGGLRPRFVACMAQESFLPRDMTVGACIGLFQKKIQSEVSGDDRIAGLMKMKVKCLSPGERRHIELLLVLSIEKPIVLLDEPFSELDPILKENAIGLIRKARLKKAIIIADQDYRSVMACSTSIALLAGGSIAHPVSGDELKRLGFFSC